MKYKYEFDPDTDEDISPFTPGDCERCPFSYEESWEDEDDGYDSCTCCSIKGGVVREYKDCPLEKVE